MRGPPRPAAGPTASLSLSSWLPAPRQGLADILVRVFGISFGFEPVGHDGPRDAAGMHVAHARAFRAAAKQRALWVHQRRVSRLYVSSAAGAAASLRHRQSAAMELTRWRLDGDRDEDCDRAAGCGSKRARAGLSPPRWSSSPLLCWLSPSRRSPPTPTPPARPGSLMGHRRRRLLPWSPVQPADMAAFQAP
jgi:hypothetical protein